MQKKILKTSLFGFSKAEVCDYITRVNSDFNDKISTLSAEHAKEKEELLAQIAALTAEVEKYKQANGDIAQALFDAQKYASELRAKADDEYRCACDELLKKQMAQTEKLNDYNDGIENIRKSIVALLSQIDGNLEDVQKNSQNLIDEYKSEEGIAI